MNKLEEAALIEAEMDANVSAYIKEKEEANRAFWYYLEMVGRCVKREGKIEELERRRKGE